MSDTQKRILLIEDSKSTLMTYKRIFEDGGFSVLEATTGQEGWDITLSDQPDLVVLDLILPDMHGLEVLKNIRSHVNTKNIPVLVLTTVQDTEEVQRTLSFGASRYVHKGSITPEKIIETLYLAALSRFPQEEEVQLMLQAVQGPGAGTRREAVEDVLWALLNSKEFVFNH